MTLPYPCNLNCLLFYSEFLKTFTDFSHFWGISSHIKECPFSLFNSFSWGIRSHTQRRWWRKDIGSNCQPPILPLPWDKTQDGMGCHGMRPTCSLFWSVSMYLANDGTLSWRHVLRFLWPLLKPLANRSLDNMLFYSTEKSPSINAN